MGKGSSSYPAAPDPVATAAAQTASNKETAITQARLNQINEVTPYGSATYSPTGQKADGVDLYQRTITLSPDQQAILDLQNGLTKQAYGIGQTQLGQIGTTLASPLDLSSLPAAPSASDAARQQTQDALYARAKAQLDPMYDQQRRQLETKLVNQGFAIGSDGYNNAISRFEQTRSNAYEAALQDAIAGGGAEQSRLFGLESTARQNALQEQLTQRNQPINELAALLGTSSGVQVPQFSSVPQTAVAGTDVTSAINNNYNAQVGAYNAQQQNNNASMGSLFGLAGSALGAWLSDPKAKTDRQPVSDDKVLAKVRTMPVDSWRYKGDAQRRIGPMAPDFAARFGGSPHMIDGQAAFGVSMAAIKALGDKVSRLERRAS